MGEFGGLTMVALHLIVALPVSIVDKQLVKRSFTGTRNPNGLAKVVGRLIGSNIQDSSGIKESKNLKTIDHTIQFVVLRNGGSVVVLTHVFHKKPALKELQLATNHKAIGNLISKYGLKVNLQGQVDGVVGVTTTDTRLFQKLPDYWGSFVTNETNHILVSNILEHLVTRVAVERAILTWATKKVMFPMNLFWAGLVAYRVRRWPVELLSDRKIHTDLLFKMRTQFNLPNVRSEILDRARSWWATLAASFALISVIGMIAQLLTAGNSNG